MQKLKETAFQDTLVPTGQLAELLFAHAERVVPAKVRNQPVQDCFESLNYAALFILTTREESELLSVTTAIIKIRTLLAASLKSAATATSKKYVAYPFIGGVRRAPAASSVKLQAVMTEALKKLTPLLQSLRKTIGYDGASHALWLSCRLRVPSPLTKGNRLNRWRTFVRNTSWKNALTIIDLAKEVPEKNFFEHTFSNRVGKESAEALWAATFSQLPSVALDPAQLTPLPSGITVVTLPDGLLEVIARLDPKATLTATQLKDFNSLTKSKEMPVAMTAQLRQQEQRFLTDCLGLSDTVSQAITWKGQKAKEVDSLIADFERMARDIKVKTVKDKMAKFFDPSELALLQEIVSTKP